MSLVPNRALEGAAGNQGYNLQRSLRFRSSASAYLSRTPASAGNRQVWTYSGWLKEGSMTNLILFNQYTDGNNQAYAGIGSDSQFRFYDLTGGAFVCDIKWAMVFRDPSSWYHIEIAVDTTQATNTNRIKLFVNGVQQTNTTSATWPSQNANLRFNNNTPHNIGQNGAGSAYFDGYLAEVNFIDGQALTPSSFGQTDPVTGVWTPKKYTGTYGTNGFYLPFSDNTSATTLAYDKSGNGNNWTANNISTTAGATYDSMTDVPTLTSATAGNYCTWNPLTKWRGTLSDGNLTMSGTAGNTTGTMSLPSGKWYFECKVLGGNNEHNLGFATSTVGAASSPGAAVRGSGSYVIYTFDGKFYNSGTASAALTTFAANDIIMLAYDADNSKIYVGKNGTWLNSAVPASGTGAVSTTATAPLNAIYQFDSGNATGCNVNFGQQPFSYTPPTGFKALNTFNLPDPTIKKPNQYMDATTYTGTGVSNAVVNAAGFQPDLVWLKNRNYAPGTNHVLIDSVRGTSVGLASNLTNADFSVTANFSGINSNGFTVTGTTHDYNFSTDTFVGWQWKESATAGFDIVTYTGTGSARTVSHSLGVAPKMMFVKMRSGADNWLVYSSLFSAPADDYLLLNSTAAKGTFAGYWNGGANASTFGLGSYNAINANGGTYVAYLFSEIPGFSKFGSYTGNGSADGPFVYCGFRPKYVMTKNTSAVGDWHITDTSRFPYNGTNAMGYLDADTSSAESAAAVYDGLSNGFKIRDNGSQVNTSGATYIYAAFAENPFKYSLAR